MADNPMLDPSISYSTNRFLSNGSQTTFEVSFAGGYISQSNVKAYYVNALGNIVLVSLTFIGPNTVSIGSPIPSGLTLVVYRDTPKDAPLVDFTDGSTINEKNLDKLARQAILATGEVLDRFNETITTNEQIVQDFTDDINASIAVVQANIDEVNDDIAELTTSVSAANTTAANAVTIANGAVTSAGTANTTAADAVTIANSAVGVANGATLTANNTQSQFASLLATVNSIAGTDFTGFVQTTGDQAIAGVKRFSGSYLAIGANNGVTTRLYDDGRFSRNNGANLYSINEWAHLFNKPATFAPSAHTHVKADITDLSLAVADITGLTTALAGKQAQSARLDAFAGVAPTNQGIPYYTSSGGAMAFTVTQTYGRSLLNTASAAALQAVAAQIGDLLYTMAPPPSGFVPADDSTYLSSVYPAAAALLPAATGSGLTTVTAGDMRPANAFLAASGNAGFTTMVFVGPGGQAAVTTDAGTTAVMTNSGTRNTLRDVCYNTSLTWFVAVGDAGTIITSSDGIQWTTRTSGTAQNLRGVCYDATLNVLVAVGDNSTILTSSDGVAWTVRTPPAAGVQYNCVYADQSGTIAIGTNTGNYVYNTTTANATAWSAATLASGGGSPITSGRWSGGALLFATAASGLHRASGAANLRANTWSFATFGSGTVSKVFGTGTYHMLVISTGTIFYNPPNGNLTSGWTSSGSLGSAGPYAVAWTGSDQKLIALQGHQADGRMYTTTNSTGASTVSSTTRVLDPNYAVQDAATSGDSRVVLALISGTAVWRQDLGYYYPVGGDTADGRVIWNGTYFVRATNVASPAISTSPDGDTWTARTAPGSTIGGCGGFVTIGTDLYIWGPNGGLWKSADQGVTWSVVGTVGAAIVGMAALNGLLYALASNGTVYKSVAPFSSWAIVPTSIDLSPYTWSRLGSGGGVLVAATAGTSFRITTSTDGKTWSAPQQISGTGNPTKLLYFSGAFMFGHTQMASTGIVVSTTGYTWTTLPVGGGTQTNGTTVMYNPAAARFEVFGTTANGATNRVAYSPASPAAFRVPYAQTLSGYTPYVKIG
ncbi:tail fiber protein [Caulobacter phage KSC]|uniref:Tail fiber protein n=1 Tax=Caulobacter phage KSC TaxID=3020398 RepID=A0AAF0BAV3_9CAUD|nr:tail fiber protein [Caulobacter phage KSC]